MITKTQMELMEIIGAIQKLQNNLPRGCYLHVDMNGDDSGTIYVHTHQDHAVGLEVKRLLGIEDADKSNYADTNPWHSMTGKLSDGFYVTIMCKGLPPTCRIEEYEEEVPKEQVIQTGEKTVVKRTRICCGEQVRAQ